ncbi:hypothetical protein RHMOL_Rhmol01G0240100 [Rhododendron molle]|nr:hypothetical protein RHMOL_Rhmol01G0240100 [Rhododendron molle]
MVQSVRNSSGVDDLHAILATLCWMLWKGRNIAYFDKKFWTCSTTVEKAITLCEEFKAATETVHALPRLSTPPHPSSWLPPPPNVIKLNVDGAVNKKNGISGAGIVARNHLGEILGSISIPFLGFLLPRSTEALAFREALITAAIRGFSEIIVEGDSLQVVQALIQDGKSLSDCSSILADCVELIPLFSSCSFIHVKRSCNRIAHSLAKQSLLGAKLECWGGPVSQHLASLARDDIQSSDCSLS